MPKPKHVRYGPGGMLLSTGKGMERIRKLCPKSLAEQPDGVALESTPLLMAAQDVFSPAELEARLAEHRRRILRECPALQRGTLGE